MKCGKEYSSKYFWMELVSGILVAFVFAYGVITLQGPGEIVLNISLALVLIFFALVDIENKKISNILNISISAITLLIFVVMVPVYGLWTQWIAWRLVAGFSFFLMLLLFKYFNREKAFGGGDIKYSFFCRTCPRLSFYYCFLCCCNFCCYIFFSFVFTKKQKEKIKICRRENSIYSFLELGFFVSMDISQSN